MSVAVAQFLIPETRWILEDVRWETYLSLLEDLEHQPGMRLSYDRGTLEFISPSRSHESIKKLLGRMVETLTLELEIDCMGGGSTTWKRADIERGIEPDECYYLANEPRVRGKAEIDLLVDPPPDLVIEVEISRSKIDKLAIYAQLGVPELWLCDGVSLKVFVLDQSARYLETSQSLAFPFLPMAELLRFVARAFTASDTQVLRSFRDWVRGGFGPAP